MDAKIISDAGHSTAHTMVLGGKLAVKDGYISGVLTGMGGTAAVVTALGAVVGLSAGLTQMDYEHKRKGILHLYSEEIASKLNKPVKKLKNRDLEAVAHGDARQNVEGNAVIAEALGKARRQRNRGIFLSIGASLASFGVLLVAAHFGLFPHAMALEGAARVSAFAIQGITGLATYKIAKAGLSWAGDQILGGSRSTAHERIIEIERDREEGKSITREQVFSVFVKANPELKQLIKHQYKKSFDDLPLELKQQLADSIGAQMQVDRLTQDINSGRVNVTELAFAVTGQESGRPPRDLNAPEKTGWLGTIKDKVLDAMHLHKETPQKSFAERVGRSSQENLTHVQRVEQSRENPLIQR